MRTFRIGAEIGAGGMAAVHLAMQEGAGGFEKLVAFKRIMPWVAHDDHLSHRFLKEARLAASLDHPNIVATLDVGEDDVGPYILMEYLRGESVAYLLTSRRNAPGGIPIGIACHIAAQVAAGLDYAHSLRGPHGEPSPIVHRDVSPSNVMVSYNGSIKLLDFGIATRPAEEATQISVLKGKVSHMAPEQLAGAPVDPRADVFQLGVVLWEMLTLRRLFPGGTNVQRMHSVLYRDIPPPSLHNPSVPPELDEIVLYALERDLGRRCPTAGILQDRLERLSLAEQPTAGSREIRGWLAQTFPERITHWEHLERQTRIADLAPAMSVEADVTYHSGSMPLPFHQPSPPPEEPPVWRWVAWGTAIAGVLAMLTVGVVYQVLAWGPVQDSAPATVQGAQLQAAPAIVVDEEVPPIDSAPSAEGLEMPIEGTPEDAPPSGVEAAEPADPEPHAIEPNTVESKTPTVEPAAVPSARVAPRPRPRPPAPTPAPEPDTPSWDLDDDILDPFASEN